MAKREVFWIVVKFERTAAREQPHPANSLISVDFDQTVVVEIRGFEERDRRERGAFTMNGDHRGEIEIENPITVCNYKRIAAQVLAQAVQRTAGAEQNGFGGVGDAPSNPRPVPNS